MVELGVAYQGCMHPHHLEADLGEIAAMGCSYINMTVNECDWFYYRKARHELRRLARDCGLAVYLNLHGFGLFATPLPAQVYPERYPERCQRYAHGERARLACPNDLQYQAWLAEQLDGMLDELTPDGVFWDEPHFASDGTFPHNWACRCAACQEAYRTAYGGEMPATLTDDVVAFRQDSLLRFLDEMMTHVKHRRPEVENVLCLMPWERRPDHASLAPGWYGVIAWEPFVALPSLGTFSTDPYWIHERTFSYFEDNAREAIALAHAAGKRCQIWVQGVWIALGKEPEVGRTLRAAADLGADMLAVWSFRGEPGASALDWGGDADAVWQEVKDAYAAIASAGVKSSER